MVYSRLVYCNALNKTYMRSPSSRTVLAVLFGTLLLDSIGFGIVFPIIPILFTDPASPSFMLGGYSVGAQLFLAGLIAAVFGLVQFVAAPLLGELSDIYGRKRLLVIGVAVLGFSQLLFGFGIEIGSLLLLFVARTIAGFAAANISIAQATIADVSAPEDRAKNFGLIGAAFGLGFIIGPLMGGWIAAVAQNPAAPFWVSSLLGLVNVVFLSLTLRETHKRPQAEHSFTLTKGLTNIRNAFLDVDVRPLYLTSLLYFAGFTFFTSYIGVLLVSAFAFTEGDVGTFFAVVGAFVILTQTVILRIVSKAYTEYPVLFVGIPLTALTVVAYAYVPAAYLVYVLIPLMAVPQGLTMANLPALISKGVSNEKQGAAMGINGSLMALAQGLIPLVAGVITAFFGLKIAFVLGALCMLFSWVPIYLRRRK